VWLRLAHKGGGEESEEHGWIDGVAILCAVVVVVMVSAINDWQKERQFRSLQNKIDSDHTFSVLRSGELVQLPVSDLVVGDICLVKYGTSSHISVITSTLAKQHEHYVHLRLHCSPCHSPGH